MNRVCLIISKLTGKICLRTLATRTNGCSMILNIFSRRRGMEEMRSFALFITSIHLHLIHQLQQSANQHRRDDADMLKYRSAPL